MSSIGYMVSQPLAVGGNRSCPELWAITDDLRYPGYKAPTKVIIIYIFLEFIDNKKLK
jgi:hypothetical protein